MQRVCNIAAMLAGCGGLTLVDLSIVVLLIFTLQEAREPQRRRFRVPCEPVLVVDVDQTKPLGVSLSPLEVVQEGPCKVSSNIGTIPAG